MDRNMIVIIVVAIVIAAILVRGILKKKSGKDLPADATGETGETETQEKPNKQNPILRFLTGGEAEKKETEKVAKGKGKSGEKSEKPKYAPIQAYVYNDINGRCGPTVLSGEVVSDVIDKFGTLGRPRAEEDGKYRYQFNKNKNGYRPTFYPYSPDNSSTRLFRAQSHPEIEIIYDVEKDKGALEKYGLYVLFAAAVVFLMWTAVAG